MRTTRDTVVLLTLIACAATLITPTPLAGQDTVTPNIGGHRLFLLPTARSLDAGSFQLELRTFLPGAAVSPVRRVTVYANTLFYVTLLGGKLTLLEGRPGALAVGMDMLDIRFFHLQTKTLPFGVGTLNLGRLAVTAGGGAQRDTESLVRWDPAWFIGGELRVAQPRDGRVGALMLMGEHLVRGEEPPRTVAGFRIAEERFSLDVGAAWWHDRARLRLAPLVSAAYRIRN